MTLGGESDGWSRSDLVELLVAASGQSAGAIEAIVDQVSAVAARWREFADAAGVDMSRFGHVESTFRCLSLFCDRRPESNIW